MKTRIIEGLTKGTVGPHSTHNGAGNHGKFMVGRFDGNDWNRVSAVEGYGRIVPHCGWARNHIFVLDLATGEGGLFRMGGSARADLRRKRIWVCVLFEAFLAWVYTLDVEKFDEWPTKVELEVPFEFYGYRREGPAPCGVCGSDPSHWRTLS